MAMVTFEVEDELLRKAEARLAKEDVSLSLLLRNRIFEMAHATPLWTFAEESYDEEMIKSVGHLSLTHMMSR